MWTHKIDMKQNDRIKWDAKYDNNNKVNMRLSEGMNVRALAQLYTYRSLCRRNRERTLTLESRWPKHHRNSSKQKKKWRRIHNQLRENNEKSTPNKNTHLKWVLTIWKMIFFYSCICVFVFVYMPLFLSVLISIKMEFFLFIYSLSFLQQI